MRSLFLVVALATIVLMPGCKKPSAKNAAAKSDAGSNPNQPAVHASTGVVMNPGLGGGGSGGAAQAIRKAAQRAVSQNQLHDLHILIETMSGASGRMPTAQQIFQDLQQGAPATAKLVQDGSIVLTGATRREDVWAYTAEPQSVTGEHLIVSSSGVQRMAPQQLQQALQQQGR